MAESGEWESEVRTVSTVSTVSAVSPYASRKYVSKYVSRKSYQYQPFIKSVGDMLNSTIYRYIRDRG